MSNFFISLVLIYLMFLKTLFSEMGRESSVSLDGLKADQISSSIQTLIQ